MEMLEKPETLKLLKSLKIKPPTPNESLRYPTKRTRYGKLFEADTVTGQGEYDKTTLFKFITEMISISGKPDYEKERRELP